MNEPVLFVTYGGGHVNALLPVIRRFQERSVAVRVLGLTTARPVLEAQGIECLGFRNFVRSGDAGALAHGERLHEANQGGLVPEDESIAYLGLSYADLEEREGVDGAAALYAERGRQAFLPLSVLDRVLDEVQPGMVVATNSPRAERAALEAAGARGTCAACVVDLFAVDEVEWIGRPGYADRVCVISERVRRRMLAAGRSPHEVVVTGNPAFDALGAPDLAERAAAIRRERGWGDDFVVLYAAQPEPATHPRADRPGDVELPNRLARALQQIVEAEPGWRLVARPHPSQDTLGIEAGAVTEISGRDDELAPLLQAVDVVVTMTSTVGLEAAIVGTPVVSPQLSILSWSAPYVEQGIALGADTLEGIGPALRAVRAGEWQPSAELAAVGRATDNVVDVIDGLLAGTAVAKQSAR
jgi:hypothetical protein